MRGWCSGSCLAGPKGPLPIAWQQRHHHSCGVWVTWGCLSGMSTESPSHTAMLLICHAGNHSQLARTTAASIHRAPVLAIPCRRLVPSSHTITEPIASDEASSGAPVAHATSLIAAACACVLPTVLPRVACIEIYTTHWNVHWHQCPLLHPVNAVISQHHHCCTQSTQSSVNTTTAAPSQRSQYHHRLLKPNEISISHYSPHHTCSRLTNRKPRLSPVLTSYTSIPLFCALMAINCGSVGITMALMRA